MNTSLMLSSFRKEVWEFQKTLYWLPALVAALVIAAPLIQLVLLEDYQFNRIFETLSQMQQIDNPQRFHIVTFGITGGVFAAFMLIAALVQFYYFSSCLYDERRDLSVYFWRSLPVSDATTITTKLLTGALLIPAIFMLGGTLVILVMTLLAFIGCVILTLAFDISVWQFWGSANLIGNLATYWLAVLPYALWLLPVYAWLMLTSMLAKKAPFLWAFVPVALLLYIEYFIVQYFHLDSGVIATSLMDYLAITPDLLPTESDIDDSPRQALLTTLFAKVHLGGLLLSGLFIYATYWLRVNKSQS